MSTYRTRQEIFDLAWNGLKAQGFQQSMDAFGCAYRGRNGLRCAIGFCIPDEAYRPFLENRGADEEPVLSAARIRGEDTFFAECLQRCHDEAEDPEDVERQLRAFATNNNLTIPGEA